MFEDFETFEIDTGDARIFCRVGGAGPPVLLLHGFPQTHVMWDRVARKLADRRTVVAADLRGYGASSCPPSDADHAPYSKRAMAGDMARLMTALGFDRFSVAGHDRGGRVAYRLALDHPGRIERAAMLDIVPGADAWDRADARLALSFWPWSLLAQPAPLPERLIGAAPDAVIDDALANWGTPPDSFDRRTRDAYVAALSDPDHVHAICEEYRAAAGIDRDHDAADRAAGRRIACPLLILWSARGGLDTWYAHEGGPLGFWRRWGDAVSGCAIDGGHFFAEENNAAAEALDAFLRD